MEKNTKEIIHIIKIKEENKEPSQKVSKESKNNKLELFDDDLENLGLVDIKNHEKSHSDFSGNEENQRDSRISVINRGVINDKLLDDSKQRETYQNENYQQYSVRKVLNIITINLIIIVLIIGIVLSIVNNNLKFIDLFRNPHLDNFKNNLIFLVTIFGIFLCKSSL